MSSHGKLEKRRAERDLGNLSAKVLTIQDEERRRIARDLHDGVGQTLTAALMAVFQATSCPESLPTGCQAGLRDVEDLLQQAGRRCEPFPSVASSTSR